MTILVWPTELPQWMQAPDFSSAVQDPRAKSSMEAGPDKYRSRVARTSRPVDGVIRCTQAQMARLDRFWLEDTKRGVLPFIFPGQEYNNAPLLTEAGSELLTEADVQILVAELWLVQFAERPTRQPHHRSVVFNVNLSLNVLP